MKIDFTRTPDGSLRIVDANLKVLKALAIPLFTDSPDLNDNPAEAGYIRYHGGIIEVYNGTSWASQTLPPSGTNLQYLRGDKTWQTLNTLGVPENTNLYYTQGRFDAAFSAKSTSNLSEGTNKYYTDTRVQAYSDTKYVQLGGSYSNPSWIVSLDYTKITGNPTTLLGYGITDAYTKTQSDNRYLPTQDIQYPSDFPFKPFQIYEKSGKFYPSESNFDRIKSKIPLLRAYYVDYANGSGSNSGLTPALPLKTVASALAAGAKLIYVSGNQIYKIDNFGLINNATGDDVIIIATGGKAIFSAADTGNPIWTLVSGTTYSTPLTLTNRVIDSKYQNKYGFYTSLVNQTSLAACQATPGTNYIDQVGNIVYVNLIDGRVPDSNILLLKKSTNVSYRANSGYLYMENIQFMGGNGSVKTSAISGTTPGLWALFKNCDFIYGGGLGLGTTTIGEGYVGTTTNTWLEDCRSFGNDRDGLNYLSAGKVIEVNVDSHDNGGLDGTNTVNGSSAHSGIPVIRINGKYYNNFGPNVIDVQTVISSPTLGVSICLGVEAFNSLGSGSLTTSQYLPYGDFANGDINNLGLSKMYLVGCKSRDTRQAFGWTPIAQGNIIVDNSTNYIGSVTSGVIFSGYNTNDSVAFVFPNTSIITQKIISSTEGGTGSSSAPTLGQFLVSASAGSYAPTNTLPLGTLIVDQAYSTGLYKNLVRNIATGKIETIIGQPILQTNTNGTNAAYTINLTNGDNIILPSITANQIATFPAIIDGKVIYIWNMNNSAFSWSISATVAVKNPALATMSTITNQTYTAYIGSSSQSAWIRLF